MSKSVYTTDMVTIMKNSAPLNAEICGELAKTFGNVSARSVIAKAKSEGIEYIVKAKPARKKLAPTKMDIVRAIEKGLDADQGSLDGLVKATAQSLDALLSNIA
jgi:hypothetical protein